MVKKRPISQFKGEFTARTVEARNALGLSQREMARALGIPQDKYKQYEGRSFMPHEIIPQFCVITRKSETWLFTGQEAKQAERPPTRPSQKLTEPGPHRLKRTG